MKLTEEEMEFLEKYRRLCEYDKGRVDQTIDEMILENRKRKDWRVCKDTEEVRR